MIDVSNYSEDGRILQNMTLLNEEEADLNGTWIEGHWDGREYYVLEGVAVGRPSTGLSGAHAVSVDTDWVVGTLPEGTKVFIEGILVGETDETELTLSFPLAQTYSVKFDPPFPYKPQEMEVVVNEADT